MKFSEERELFAAADMGREVRPPPVADRSRLLDYVDAVVDHRWLVFLIMAVALLVGGLAARAMRPVYEANLLIQIADAAGPPQKSLLGDAANLFDIKTPATAEMEIMRSRMVVGPAAEKNRLLVVAQPRYWPIVGRWRPGYSEEPNPAWVSIGNWVHGAQSIAVDRFEVPAGWEGRTFIVRIEKDGSYSLRNRSMAAPIAGTVGELLEGSVGNGRLSLLVSQLQGDAGAEFGVVRKARGQTIEDLQNDLKLVERGRQSGIIEATLRDTDAVRAATILNEIGANYVRQNLDRKSAEAEKSLSFLQTQLPALKKQVERAEGAYNAFRLRKGTVSLPDEAKLVLERSSQLRGKLLDAQQTRRDLLSRYGLEHPSVKTLEEQISALQRELGGLQGKVRELPTVQQDALRLESDVKVGNELYQQLRNSALQLQLVREGRTGNSRIIDSAVPPDGPVRPRAAIVLGVAAFAGAVLSLLVVLIRSGLARGVRSVREIEASTGLNVYASAIPLSQVQLKADARGAARKLLALSAPRDPAVEGLRQLRTVLQHQMRDRRNNRLVITGPGAGVGVHFVAANLAAVFAAGGKRILLIDADLRRGPGLSFDAGTQPGLADLIAGTSTRKQATKATAIPQLDFIAAGSSPGNPGDLAVSPAFLDMLDQVSKEYDTVLIIAPPLLDSAETLSMASAAATVLLVTRAGKTLVNEIAESARRLSQAGQLASGVLLNGVKGLGAGTRPGAV
jgi:tyrosine-protein kinase Etk/Wzc